MSSVIVTACEPRSRDRVLLCAERENESAPRAENVRELLFQLVRGTLDDLADKVMRRMPLHARRGFLRAKPGDRGRRDAPVIYELRAELRASSLISGPAPFFLSRKFFRGSVYTLCLYEMHGSLCAREGCTLRSGKKRSNISIFDRSF